MSNKLTQEAELIQATVQQLGLKMPTISEAANALYRAKIAKKLPVLCDNRSGTHCSACRGTGVAHCSDPVNCGGMKPMEHYSGCGHPIKKDEA